MSAHLTRAQVLLQQSRPADAEREAGLAAAQDPELPQAHALLALSRIEQDKRAGALEAVLTAIRLAPDAGRFHHIHALVLHRSQRNREALAAAREAIRLEPEDDDSFSLLAAIHLNLGAWKAALAAAEQALALQPENTEAANFRSMALVRLGRKAEAMATVDSALARDPESAFSHANQGWNRLHQSEPKQALEHFREALRLDPNLDYAREGMIEALKAHNPIYRAMLAYFLWMSRLDPKVQWGVILGLFFARRVLREMATQNPALQPVLIPILILGTLFVFLTWTAQPLFNLLLRLHPYGRHALSREQRIASNVVASLLGAGLLLAVTGLLTKGISWYLAALAAVVLMIPTSATFELPPGRWRWAVGLATVGLGLCGAAGLALSLAGDERGLALFAPVFLGTFVLSFVANLGHSRRS